MGFKTFFAMQEARRNPEQNPKIPAINTLKDVFDKNYEGATPKEVLDDLHSDLYFVSMTAVDKLGINPTSKYDTPLGIYSYPLSYVLHRVESKMADLSSGTPTLASLPFAGKQPYVNLFKTDYNRNIVCLNSQDFDSISFQHYTRKIGSFLARWRIETLEKQFSKTLSDANREVYWKNSVDMIEELANKSEHRARIPNWGGRFWYVTMMVADFMATAARKEDKPKSFDSIVKGKVKGASLMWNKLFREIGIDACVDYGDGIIHGSEMTQAVFFSVEPIEIVDRIQNKDYISGGNNPSVAHKINQATQADFYTAFLRQDEHQFRKAYKLYASVFKRTPEEPDPVNPGLYREFSPLYNAFMKSIRSLEINDNAEEIAIMGKFFTDMTKKPLNVKFVTRLCKVTPHIYGGLLDYVPRKDAYEILDICFETFLRAYNAMLQKKLADKYEFDFDYVMKTQTFMGYLKMNNITSKEQLTKLANQLVPEPDSEFETL